MHNFKLTKRSSLLRRKNGTKGEAHFVKITFQNTPSLGLLLLN